MNVSKHLYIGVGSAVRAARKEARLTQQQLASAVGLTRTSISNIEMGRQKMLLDGFYRISLALHVEPDRLLTNALAAAQSVKTLAPAGSFEGLSDEERGIIEEILNLSAVGGKKNADTK